MKDASTTAAGLPASLLPGAGAAAGRREAVLEVLQVASGVALVGFMWSHVVLVSSVLLGAPVMDRLARFLEDTRLAQFGSPVVVLLFFLHATLAARKIPAQAAERRAALERMAALRHWDSITWMVQVVTGMAILVLGAVHFWVILTDFPIEALKSAGRVRHVYLFMYLPLLLFVELHASVGLYRAAIKWGFVPRGPMKRLEALLTVFFLALGGLTLAALYRLGAGAPS